MSLIYTICKDKQEAKKIATMLIKLKLVACANYWPIASVCRWQNKIVNGQEVAMILKTRNSYYKKVELLIKKTHSYETPCVLRINADQIEKKYLEWLMKETRII